MSISKKLYRSFGSILIIVVLLFVVNIGAVWYEHRATDSATMAAEMVQSVYKFDQARMQNRLHLRNFLLSGDPKEVADLKDGRTQTDALINAAEGLASTLPVALGQDKDKIDPRQLLEELRNLEISWTKEFAEPLVQKRLKYDEGRSSAAELSLAYMQADPEKWKVRETGPLKDLDSFVQNMRESAKKAGANARFVTWTITVAGFLVVLLIGARIAWTSAKGITTPLHQLILVSSQIANSGDLDQKVEIYSSDEIGELAATFNRMVEYLREMANISVAIAGGDLSAEITPRSPRDTLGNAFHEMTIGLRSLVKNVRDSAAQVASGSSQVASASDDSAKISVQAASAIDEVTSTMHEMSINVQNMVKSTQLQSSNVSETSASIDEMVASIQRVADTAKVLLDISQRSRDEVHSGINTMQKATDGLNRINSSISSSAEIISVLGQRADDIGKIIEVIDDLAEQTNLLALNAAIEAARAGEHGLGFAVVADEVRKLAEKSAQSTREISDLIQSIQKEARKAVENMEKSTTIVNEGLTLGGDLSSALKKISNVVAEVYKFAQEIGAATNEQSHGSSQIAKATTRLNEITHEINSSVEEQASGAQAVVKAMEKMRELVQRSSSGSTELAASSEQMSKMARTMLESMDRFVFDITLAGNGRNGSARDDQQPKRPGSARYAAASPAYN
ncbi:MAG TPA: methyl-accepting chemotaxis protein [Candidatus Saccharimonadales bacterium]|jgi:methyl-accepting chemotaxis protein|nr:methyl-accepting chemotaxis protein [Candidatus Saccharimonadales bacterium]